MGIVVVGSLAFDSIQTPFGQCERVLGGSANYFALAARFFSPVQMVGVVGEDFPNHHLKQLQDFGIQTHGIQTEKGHTFHWKGSYGYDLNQAQTIQTDLNVFARFLPTLPSEYRFAKTVFLANIDPKLQLHVLDQVHSPQLIAMDTMNFWIENAKETLLKVLSRVHLLFINEGELRQLTQEYHVTKAIRILQKQGLRIIVVKRGEYGAMLFYDDHIFFVPAFPLEELYDPTGAGDTFAGGFLGWLHKKPINLQSLKEAMHVGTIMASFAIEDFSFKRLTSLSLSQIQERLIQLHHFGNSVAPIELPQTK